MTNAYIDYREKLRALHTELSITNSNDEIGAGIAFYDWCMALEAAYRKSNNLTYTTLISEKAVYEWAVKLQ